MTRAVVGTVKAKFAASEALADVLEAFTRAPQAKTPKSVSRVADSVQERTAQLRVVEAKARALRQKLARAKLTKAKAAKARADLRLKNENVAVLTKEIEDMRNKDGAES